MPRFTTTIYASVVPCSFDTYMPTCFAKGRRPTSQVGGGATKNLVRERTCSLMNPLYREKRPSGFNFLAADRRENFINRASISSIRFSLC